jgi:hypothetical protein
MGAGLNLQKPYTFEKLGKSIRDELNRTISDGGPDANGSDMNNTAG